MPDVYITADHIVSPLGDGTAANFRQLSAGVSGIGPREGASLSARPFQASLLSGAQWSSLPKGNTAFGEMYPESNDPASGSFTRFEQLLIAAIGGALRGDSPSADPANPDTVLIISTTKGNISLLETELYSPALRERIALHTSARLVGAHFGFVTPPIVVSNACISGILAIITGARLLRGGRYKHAVIAGADVISRFIMSGFESFQAVSPEPCKPFDAARSGISLGEGAGAMILSTIPGPASGPIIRVLGGATGNDANHISGPSRTGEELAQVISRALAESGALEASHDPDRAGRYPIDFISAHGTATPYNDEMEAKAVTIAGLGSVPIHSLKGYYGHTFGAAGLIESVVAVRSLQEDCLIPSKGFEQLGVSEPINVIRTLVRTPLAHCLKTASGFGGCNAAVVFTKSGAV